MTTYSVYDYDKRLYTYYEASGPGGTHAGAPPSPPFRNAIGASPEGAAWSLPLGARRVGSGPLPKGRVSSSRGSLGGLGDLTADIPRLGLAVVVAYLAWRHLR